jgi:V/A-type H+-transporting ATPase subunit E
MALPVEKGAQLIAEDILREAREKAARIIRDAKKEAQTLLDAARFGAREEEEREVKEAKVRGKSIYEEMLAGGRMKAKREILQKREELINDVFKKAEESLRRYASSEKYEKDLPRIAVSACRKLGSDRITIQANRRDLKLLEKNKDQIARELSGEKAASISFGAPIQTIGGIKVGALEEKIEIDETFENKMRRIFETLRVKVAKVLFEGSK